MFPKFFDVQKYFWASENSFGRPNRCLDVQSSFCNAPILSDANTIFWTSSDTCMMPGKVSSQDVVVQSYRWKALSGSVTGSQIAIRAITLVQNKYGCNCFAHFLSLFFPLCLLLAFFFVFLNQIIFIFFSLTLSHPTIILFLFETQKRKMLVCKAITNEKTKVFALL